MDERTSPRLEYLEERLLVLIEEIKKERKRLKLKVKHYPDAITTRGKPRTNHKSLNIQLLEELGVTTMEVRVWALQKGLIDKITRGSLKYEIIQAYADEKEFGVHGQSDVGRGDHLQDGGEA